MKFIYFLFFLLLTINAYGQTSVTVVDSLVVSGTIKASGFTDLSGTPIGGGGGGGITFDSSAVVTGDTWIDGKPIYVFTKYIASLPNAIPRDHVHGIANIDQIIKIDGYVLDGTDFLTVPFTKSGTFAGLIEISADATNLHIGVAENRNGDQGWFNIYHTKTTD